MKCRADLKLLCPPAVLELKDELMFKLDGIYNHYKAKVDKEDQ
jgi:hypothetical protein